MHRQQNKLHCILTHIVLLFWIFGVVSFVHAEDDFGIKAYLDRTAVGLNQQFTLHVEFSGKGANSALNPELPKMDDFATFLGSGSSQNIQIVNGKMSVSKTINYHFQATAVGTFQIDPVTVTYSGQVYKSDPVTIEVQKTVTATRPSQKRREAAQGTGIAEKDLFIRAFVNKKQVYQNEQVILTYKIYTLVNVSSFGFAKIPSTGGFWVEEFPLEGQPKMSTEVFDGKKYTVATIRRVALFPMTPGPKTIEPLAVDCEVRVKRRSRDLFDDFFSDPFFGRTVRKRIQSPSVSVEVLPLPVQGRPTDFSGVVGHFSMTAWVDKSQVETNEAVSYKVKIEGQGNIGTLPDPKVQCPSDFEMYPPKVSEKINRKNSAVSGSKVYEFVLVPRVAGMQKIKPVRLSYFNPAMKTYKTIQTKEIVIDVAKGEEMFLAVPSGLSKEEVKLLGQDIRFIKIEIPSFLKIGDSFYKHVEFWLILIFPLFCLGGALLYRRHVDRLAGDIAYARDRRANRAAKARLSKAKSLLKESTQKEFYAEVSRALTGYLGDKLNIAEAGLMTDQVQKLLRGKGVKNEDIERFFGCIRTCDLKRFSPSDTNDQEMKEFLRKAQSAILQVDQKISR